MDDERLSVYTHDGHVYVSVPGSHIFKITSLHASVVRGTASLWGGCMDSELGVACDLRISEKLYNELLAADAALIPLSALPKGYVII
jgi:hypothetical protein